jgi:ABC-2 type transport system permease protein
MTTAGTGTLVRFMLRRERRSLPWWLLGITALVYYQSVGSQSVYDTPEKLASLRELMGGNAAVVAMGGPTELLENIGGEVVFEIFAFASIVVCLMNMFLVGRHTRADEEAGRAELIRSARVGRSAPLLAALSVAGLANLGVGILVFVATVGTGLPVDGSAVFAAGMTAVGLTFAAVTAVAAQAFENHRAVYGAVGAAIGGAFLLRAAGDVGNGVLSWFSPIGWGQQTLPYVANRWWPLLLPLAATVALAGLAVLLLAHRDFGAGLIASRLGPANASPALSTPVGLAWRLQRGSLIGWAVGLFVLGAAYGSFADSMEQFVADNPDLAAFLPGGAAGILNAYLAFTMLFNALMTAAYGVSAALRARAEEAAGRAEPILATRTSKWAWLGSHVTVALVGSAVVLVAAGLGEGLAYGMTIDDLGQIPRLMGVALVYLPATWVLVAIAVLGFGWLPRAAYAVAWAAFGFCALVAIFADVFKFPAWLQNISPFAHTPQAPVEDVTITPMLGFAVVVVALAAAGFVGFRRRDVG